MKVQCKQIGNVLLPDFLIVGAAKSATTSLHHYLAKHPEVRMPTIKESWFFSFVNNPPSYTSPGGLSDVVSTLDEYVKLFADATPEQRLGDASPSYLYTYHDAIRNIQSIYPPENLAKLKIIISLREPTRRALSQFWTFKRSAREPLAFEEAVESSVISQRLADNWNIFYDYIGFGAYYEQVKAYLDAFGEDRVLILLYDDIQSDVAGACRTVYDFVGVDPEFMPDLEQRHNSLSGEPTQMWLARTLKSRNPVKQAFAACIPKHVRENILKVLGKRMLKRPEMPEELKQRLKDLYSEDIARLETLIYRDLSRWKRDV